MKYFSGCYHRLTHDKNIVNFWNSWYIQFNAGLCLSCLQVLLILCLPTPSVPNFLSFFPWTHFPEAFSEFRIYHNAGIMIALNYRPKRMTVYLNIPLKPLMLSFKNWQKRVSLSYRQTEILLTHVCVLAKGINFKRRKIVDRKWQM